MRMSLVSLPVPPIPSSTYCRLRLLHLGSFAHLLARWTEHSMDGSAAASTPQRVIQAGVLPAAT
jgi:hypothetical protein